MRNRSSHHDIQSLDPRRRKGLCAGHLRSSRDRSFTRDLCERARQSSIPRICEPREGARARRRQVEYWACAAEKAGMAHYWAWAKVGAAIRKC